MPNTPSLSLVMPAYNEEKNILLSASSIIKVLEGAAIDYELVLVDNGSTDKTGEKINALAKQNSRIKKVVVNKNIGYGYGVRKGLDASKGKYIGWTDADNQVDAHFVTDMYKKIECGKLDLVMTQRKYRHDSLSRRVASLFYNSLVSLFFFTRIGDTNAKPKIFKKEAYEKVKITSNDWFIDTELLLKFKARKYSMAFIDCISNERAHGNSNVKLRTVWEFFRNIVLFRAGMI